MPHSASTAAAGCPPDRRPAIRMMRLRLESIAFAVLLALAAGSASAQVPGMPDARQMSGVPLPVGDLANGTVTVRVVRGAMTNPLAGQTVSLIVGSATLTATTNDAGRAEFPSLTPGARVKAAVTVAGERL